MGSLSDGKPGFDTASAEATAGRIWWDRTFFLSDQEIAGGPCPPVIDVTGRSRILVYGPNQELAAGDWRATVLVHLSPEAAHRRMAIQFGADPDYTTVDLKLGVAGDHKIEVTFATDTPWRCQIRLWLKKAAFHGEVRFAGASVERTDRSPATTDHTGSTDD